MYNTDLRESLKTIADTKSKQNTLLLRVYANEQDYENGIYTEVSGENVSDFSYEHSINSNNYFNFGDVCAGNVEIDLLTKGYGEDEKFISLFKEFAIIKPYILQTGKWEHLISGYGVRGLVALSESEYDSALENDLLDTNLAYITYTDKQFEIVEELPENGNVDIYYLVSYSDFLWTQYQWNGNNFIKMFVIRKSVDITADYVCQILHCYKNNSWQDVSIENFNSKNDMFASFPLGKFYVTDIETTDYYRNMTVTAYDALGFVDFNAVNIDGVAPTVDYKDQEGLVNYFLYKNNLVDYDSDNKILMASFSQHVSNVLGKKHTIVTELPEKGVSGINYLILRDDSKYDVYVYTDNGWHCNGTTTIGTYTSYICYYPDNSVTVRTLLSYLAQFGEEGKCSYNLIVNRNGELDFKPYSMYDYSITTNDMLSLTLNNLPTDKTVIGNATCTSTVTDEDTGNSISGYTIGSVGSGLSLSLPTNNSSSIAEEALTGLIELAQTYYTRGVDIVESKPTWKATIDNVFQLFLVPNEYATSKGFTAYTVVSQDSNTYIWKELKYDDWDLFEYLSSSLEWSGDLNLECGDIITIYDELGNDYHFPIMSMSIDFDGGIKQKLSADGSSSSSISLSQNSTSFSTQLEQSYPVIQNAIKKVAYTGGEENTGMVALIDDGTDNVPNALIVSEYSSEDEEHNWLNEGSIVRFDNEGIKRSNSGLRGNFNDCVTYDGLFDSGWQILTLNSAYFKDYSSNDTKKLMCRKIGNIVEVKGEVKPSIEIAGSTTKYKITTLPSGFRPDSTIYEIQQGSTYNKWLSIIDTQGELTFSRYGSTEYITVTTSTWLPIHFIFFI